MSFHRKLNRRIPKRLLACISLNVPSQCYTQKRLRKEYTGRFQMLCDFALLCKSCSNTTSFLLSQQLDCRNWTSTQTQTMPWVHVICFHCNIYRAEKLKMYNIHSSKFQNGIGSGPKKCLHSYPSLGTGKSMLSILNRWNNLSTNDIYWREKTVSYTHVYIFNDKRLPIFYG